MAPAVIPAQFGDLRVGTHWQHYKHKALAWGVSGWGGVWQPGVFTEPAPEVLPSHKIILTLGNSRISKHLWCVRSQKL